MLVILESPTRPPPEACGLNEYTCDDGQCIDEELKCDRKYDCGDGSDEFHCGEQYQPFENLFYIIWCCYL